MEHELWAISGREPVEWTLPVAVVWVRPKLAHIELAMPLRAIHRAAMTFRLRTSAKKELGGWTITREELELAGVKTPGGDPDLYFKWLLPDKPLPPPPTPEQESTERKQFLDGLFAAGVGRSREELDYYYTQFCKHMLHTLTNEQKPVDLFFLKLHPTPYRANWMHMLCSRFPKLWRSAGTLTGYRRDWVLVESGFMDHLISLDLLAMNAKDSVCQWRVEVEHRPAWWKTSRKAELARLALKGVYGYAALVMDSVKRALPVALRRYGAHLAEIARPSVDSREGEPLGNYRFVPHIPKNGVRPHPPAPGAVPPILPNKPPAFTPACDTALVSAPYVQVSDLPTIQSETQNVWNSRGELLQPAKPAPGAQGLPVLPSDEELA